MYHIQAKKPWVRLVYSWAWVLFVLFSESLWAKAGGILSFRPRTQEVFPLFYYQNQNFKLAGRQADYKVWRNLQIRAQLKDDSITSGPSLQVTINPYLRSHLSLAWDQYGLPNVSSGINWQVKKNNVKWQNQMDLVWQLRQKPELQMQTEVQAEVIPGFYLYSALEFPQADLIFGVGSLQKGSSYRGFYLRLFHGHANPATVSRIIKARKPRFYRPLLGLAIGLPLSKTIFSLPLPLYFQPGFAYHLQEKFPEISLALKLYYASPWSFLPLRLGVGQGLSYSYRVNQLEKSEALSLGEKGRHLLHYSDFTIDLDLHFVAKRWLLRSFESPGKFYFGWMVHNRSGILAHDGLGSNYRGAYLQYRF